MSKKTFESVGGAAVNANRNAEDSVPYDFQMTRAIIYRIIVLLFYFGDIL